MKKLILNALYIAALWLGEYAGIWNATAALFAIVLTFGLEEIADAIRYRHVNVHFTGPIELKNADVKEDSTHV